MTATSPDLADLAVLSRQFEDAPASDVVAWAVDTYGDGLVLASSFQDCVLLDIALKVAPDLEVVFLDTGFHFAETMWFADRVRQRYKMNLTVMHPKVEVGDLWQLDVDSCCGARKVEPLARALEGRAAWMTAVRRVEAPTRATTPIVSLDVGRGLVKINPIATWTDDQVGRLHRRARPARPPAGRPGLPVDRLLAVHPPRRRRRGPPRRPLVGPVQDGVRPARLMRDRRRR